MQRLYSQKFISGQISGLLVQNMRIQAIYPKNKIGEANTSPILQVFKSLKPDQPGKILRC